MDYYGLLGYNNKYIKLIVKFTPIPVFPNVELKGDLSKLYNLLNLVSSKVAFQDNLDIPVIA